MKQMDKGTTILNIGRYVDLDAVMHICGDKIEYSIGVVSQDGFAAKNISKELYELLIKELKDIKGSSYCKHSDTLV